MRKRSLSAGTFILLVTLVSSKANGQSAPPDPGRWAYPQHAAFHSDPSLIDDFVPCLFDLDQSRNFRAMKFPDLEKAAQSDAREAIQGSSLSPEVRSQLISALPRVTLSALTPESVHAFIKGSAETALQSSNLPSEDKKNAAEAVANSVTRTVLQNSPIKRPPDVSCGMSVLPWNITRWAFGREIADNFIVVQVTVRNLNNQQQFLVHDVELAVDTQPGIFNRFGSSTDQATIDGVALTAEEGWSSRSLLAAFGHACRQYRLSS